MLTSLELLASEGPVETSDCACAAMCSMSFTHEVYNADASSSALGRALIRPEGGGGTRKGSDGQRMGLLLCLPVDLNVDFR